MGIIGTADFIYSLVKLAHAPEVIRAAASQIVIVKGWSQYMINKPPTRNEFNMGQSLQIAADFLVRQIIHCFLCYQFTFTGIFLGHFSTGEHISGTQWTHRENSGRRNLPGHPFHLLVQLKTRVHCYEPVGGPR
jgi:hypothetical protein